MDGIRWKRLADVAAEQNVSVETARRAALNGTLPAIQLFGKGSNWMVHPDYEAFLLKARVSLVDDSNVKHG